MSDPATVSPPEANARRHGLDDVASFSTAPAECAELGAFEVVVANITADALIALAANIAARVGPDGRLAVSGISAAQASTKADQQGISLSEDIRRLVDRALAEHAPSFPSMGTSLRREIGSGRPHGVRSV